MRELHLDEEHHHYELDRRGGQFPPRLPGLRPGARGRQPRLCPGSPIIGQARGFVVDSAQVELTGYCAECQGDAKARKVMEPKSALDLGSVPKDASVCIRALTGGHTLVSRLACLGFTPGVHLRVLQNWGMAPYWSPCGTRAVALGRGEARRSSSSGRLR